ncbi:RidA family protein [Microbacterium sp. RD1]|uniref:RidA family protein n=1 Tax=Microbacterium sp. RD1 TaxID=3457313 RepID=UPI003FA5F856
MPITRTNPAGVHSEPGLISQAAVTRDVDLAFLSGQVAWNEDGEIQGVGDLAAQVAQITANIDKVLASLGVGREAIVKETIYVVDWNLDLLPVVLGGLSYRQTAPPAGTLVGVAALFHPDVLIEVDVVVAVPR